jgi:hypothetical protein
MAGKPDEAVVVSKAESAYTIMLTSLLQFQALGWEYGFPRSYLLGEPTFYNPVLNSGSGYAFMLT